MKLTRLRLLGFKSFVEPTDFMIERGLTGVVGPNGCGKSNLVEALRWVMGESSHKSLRAADMDDVIFSGTNNRPGRNNAEVAIQIDNSARKAPAQFNEHETLDVSRRIERDVGSTYRINGREVRARDVQILFADASTGSRSPSMVHQGRIGEIIQAKPEQRRRAALARPRVRPIKGKNPLLTLKIGSDLLVQFLRRQGAAEDLAVDEEGRRGVDVEFIRRPVARFLDALEHPLILQAFVERLLGKPGLFGDRQQRLQRLLHHPVRLLCK